MYQLKYKYFCILFFLISGDYTFDINLSDAKLKVCKIEITHIGANMPCTEPPGPSLHGYENTEVVYADGVVAEEHMCGKKAQFKFYVSSYMTLFQHHAYYKSKIHN